MKHRIAVGTICFILACIFGFAGDHDAGDRDVGPDETSESSPHDDPESIVEDTHTRTYVPTYVRERADEREYLVEHAVIEAGITNESVIRAMSRVPRHRYVPTRYQAAAYTDQPLPIGYGQTISQPFIVAYMTQALEIDASSKVLEIGTGSAYQASVLGEITRQVFTVEIIPQLAESARRILDELGYGYVRSKQGDGYYGWEEEAPFDAIIVTAAADHVPPALISQLGPGGVMIIPVGSPMGVQTLIRIRKSSSGATERDGLLYVRFVPLTGSGMKN